MVRHRHGETVLLHSYVEDAGTDQYGNPVPGYLDPVERTHCAIAPRVEVEPDNPNRTMVVDGFVVYDTYDSPVGPYDRLTVRGDLYEVDGEVARWRNPFTGYEPGCEITLKRVRG